MDIKENFATNLARYRKSLNLTQAEFAEKINYSDKAISKWERGESLPDVIVLKKIADFFKVSVDKLIEEPSNDKPKLYHNLTKKRIILFFISTFLVWLVAICAYSFTSMIVPSVKETWLAFIYAVPVNLTVVLILTSVWGKSISNLVISSCLLWSLALSSFLTLLIYMPTPPNTLWKIFLIGIPLQALLIFIFFYKRVK